MFLSVTHGCMDQITVCYLIQCMLLRNRQSIAQYLALLDCCLDLEQAENIIICVRLTDVTITQQCMHVLLQAVTAVL
jgi:hypothetical protein